MNIVYFLIFLVIPILGINYLSIKSQKRFIKLYKEKVDADEPFFIREINKKYLRDPSKFIQDSPKIMLLRFKIIFGKFHDKELDNAASDVRKYYFFIVAVLFINFIILTFTI